MVPCFQLIPLMWRCPEDLGLGAAGWPDGPSPLLCRNVTISVPPRQGEVLPASRLSCRIPVLWTLLREGFPLLRSFRNASHAHIVSLASDLIPHAQFAISLKSVSWTNGRAHLACFSSLCGFSSYCLFPVFGKLVFHVFLFFFFPLGSRREGEGISSKKINKISVTPHLPEAEGIFLCS